MIVEHLKELHSTALDSLQAAVRHCQESWIGLIAMGIGVAVYRCTRSPGRLAASPRAMAAPPTVRAAGRVARRHAAAIGQVIGRLVSAVLFG